MTDGFREVDDVGATPPRQFIVAEVLKTWIAGRSQRPETVGELFEQVIEVNRQRGYRLRMYALNQVLVAPDQLVETIIAVFEWRR